MAPPDISLEPFRWDDGDRVIRFGRGAVADVPELVGEGYVLLTTPRGRERAGGLLDLAGSVHDVPEGRVDEIAGELRSEVKGDTLLALGGGRVIDVAKALAAADPPRRVAAVPTTLSAAEMTRAHRQPRARPTAIGPGPANAVMLPHSLPALARRRPAEVEAMARAAGEDLPSIAARLGARAGPTRLRDHGVLAEQLAPCAEAALE